MSFLIGILAGTFGGLVGLGGGVVMIPLMVGVMKMKQQHAHGTSLLALVFTGIAGSITYAMNGSIDVVASLLLATSAIFTARLGAKYAHALPEWKLKRSFGIFLLFITVLLLIKPYILGSTEPVSLIVKAIALLFAGAFTGFLSGMMGVGGGSLMVPAMVLLAGMGQHIAQGSSLLAMIPAGSVGAYTHYKLGNVATKLLWGLIPGIMIGTYAGSMMAAHLEEDILRIIFAVVLIWTGSKFLKAKPPKKD